MDSLKQKVTSKVTGDAYDKPAKTKDGAFTTQDSADAHTIEGTSADPNAQGGGMMTDKMQQASDKMDDMKDKAGDAGDQARQAK